MRCSKRTRLSVATASLLAALVVASVAGAASEEAGAGEPEQVSTEGYANMVGLAAGPGAQESAIQEIQGEIDSDLLVGLLLYTRYLTPLDLSTELPLGLVEYVQHPSAVSLQFRYTDLSTTYKLDADPLGEIDGDGNGGAYAPQLTILYYLRNMPNLGIEIGYGYSRTELDAEISSNTQLGHVEVRTEDEWIENTYGLTIHAYARPETKFSLGYTKIERDTKDVVEALLNGIPQEKQEIETDGSGDEISISASHLLANEFLAGVTYRRRDVEDLSDTAYDLGIEYHLSRAMSIGLQLTFGDRELEVEGISEEEDYDQFEIRTRYFFTDTSSALLLYQRMDGDYSEGFLGLLAYAIYF